MGEAEGQGMVAFLGVPADRRLLDEDAANLPESQRYREPPLSTHEHDRLVAAGSVLTGATLIGGAALALFCGWLLLFGSGGTLDGVLLAVGLLLAGTHWGWVHVAEYVGLTIDERRERAAEHRRQDWLAGVEPYPRFSVATSVLEDASTVVERTLHRPVMTDRGTFTFLRVADGRQSFDGHASAGEIAAGVETMRRDARLETDRVHEQWDAASTAYAAALIDADDEAERLAARREAATALSEHINASLLEPPLVE
jgi:hypothetical protein